MDLDTAERDDSSAATAGAWASNQPPVAAALMLLSLVERENPGATLVPALMLDLLGNSKSKQALPLAHGTPAGGAIHPSLALPLAQAGDTHQVTLWAAGYWSFPWRHQAHWAFNQFAKRVHLSFNFADLLLNLNR